MKLELSEIYNQYLSEIESDNKSKYQEKNPGKYYRASSAGHCFKKHWFAMNGYEGKEMDEKSRRLLRLGTIVHEDIEKAINWYSSFNLGKDKSDKRPNLYSDDYFIDFNTEYEVLIEELNVMGSSDIVAISNSSVHDIDEASACVIDIKTTHSYKWKMMFGRNKEPKPSRMYELQLGTYALGVCNQENIKPEDISMYLVYYKKDDSLMKPVEVNNVWMDNAAEYWFTLNETLDMVKEEADLPRDTLNVPIEQWECRYCQFEPICN